MMIDPFGSVIEFLLPPLMIHEHEQMARSRSNFLTLSIANLNNARLIFLIDIEYKVDFIHIRNIYLDGFENNANMCITLS